MRLNESCVRLLRLRDFECRRLGFGISILQKLQNSFIYCDRSKHHRKMRNKFMDVRALTNRFLLSRPLNQPAPASADL